MIDFKEEKLNLVSIYTENFSSMARHCYRTFSDSRIAIHCLRFDKQSNHFRAENWYANLRKKIEFLKESLEKLPNDAVLGLLDCDIQCFDTNEVVSVYNYFKDSAFDYIGLAEGCGDPKKHMETFAPINESANTGFFFVRKCDVIMDFFENVLRKDFSKYSHGDQTVINEFLRSMNIRRQFFSPFSFLHGCCHGNVFRKKIVLHHATCCNNIEQKKNQMNIVRKKIGLTKIDWKDISFGDSYINCNSKIY